MKYKTANINKSSRKGKVYMKQKPKQKNNKRKMQIKHTQKITKGKTNTSHVKLKQKIIIIIMKIIKTPGNKLIRIWRKIRKILIIEKN